MLSVGAQLLAGASLVLSSSWYKMMGLPPLPSTVEPSLVLEKGTYFADQMFLFWPRMCHQPDLTGASLQLECGSNPCSDRTPPKLRGKGESWREGWYFTELRAWEPARHRPSCREVAILFCSLRLPQRLLPPTITSSLPTQDLEVGVMAPGTGQGPSFNLSPSLGPTALPAFGACKNFSQQLFSGRSARLGPAG